MFDDDSVYTISEGDISKYFGDSNAGSAYVLYYQAADIDLVELGLQPPVQASDASPVHNHVDQPDPISTADKIPLSGLEFEPATTSDPTHEFHPQPNAPDKPTLVIPLAIPDSAEQTTAFSPPALPSPSATGFGTKLFNTIRRAPSASLSRPNATTSPNATEKRRSGGERSPRLTASSPSLSDKLSLSPSEPPPPLPPLPPTIKTPEPVPPAGAPPEKHKKESSKSGGWFYKRKSLKLNDKPKKQPSTSETLFLQPPSPNRRADDQGTASSPSAWFKGLGSSHKEAQSEHTHSKDSTHDADEPKHRDGASRHLSVNGVGTDDTPPTPSTTSSLNSMTPTHPSYARPSMTGSSSSSSSIPHPSKVTSASSMRRQDSLSGVDHRRSKGSRSSSPSDRKRQRPFPPSLERALPPLPPTPTFVSHVHSPSNGYVYVEEPKAMVNGYDDSNHELNSGAPSSLYADDLQHLRSTTLPVPSSLATSAGENISSSSTPPLTAFGLRKATRKLSLTAPMLGFGKKDRK